VPHDNERWSDRRLEEPQTDTRYAEVENSNVVGEKGGQNAEIPDDADPKAIIQRAEELVNSDSMEYYRSGVAEDDYPETSVTDPMPPRSKSRSWNSVQATKGES